MENDIKLNGTVLAESDAAGTEEDPILSLIRAKYMDADGKVHLAFLQTLLSSVVDKDGKRLDRTIEELQKAIGIGDEKVTDVINAEIDKKVGDLANLPTENKSTVVGAIDELNTGIDELQTEISEKVGNLVDLKTSDKANAVAAINELLAAVNGVDTDLDGVSDILKYAGLTRSDLIYTAWNKIEKNKQLKTTFFTNWSNTTDFPDKYGSGVIIPAEDSSYKMIYYTKVLNSKIISSWVGTMFFTSNTEYTIDWKKIPLDLYDDKALGENYVMTASDFDKVGFYRIETLSNTVTDEGIKNIPDNNTGDYKVIALNTNPTYQTLLMTSPRYNNVFYIGKFWNNVWRGWTRIANTEDVSNPNFLINTNFKDVINQRGGSTYTESGKYSIDRWLLITGKVSVSNGQVTFTKVGDTNGHIVQYIENGGKLLKNKTVTLSISVNGVVYSSTFTIPDFTSSYDSGNIEFPGGYTDICGTSSWMSVRLTIRNGSVSPDWIKLELGSAATMYMPPNYGEELLKCKRYFQKLIFWWKYVTVGFASKSDKTAKFTLVLESSMRSNPTLSVQNEDRIKVIGSNINTNIASIAGIIGAGENYFDLTVNLPDGVVIESTKDFVLLYFGEAAGITLDTELY